MSTHVLISFILFQCAVMTAETACRIMSSGEENYVSSRQERIGVLFAPAFCSIFRSAFVPHSLRPTALIRRLKFRSQRSRGEGATPQTATVASSPPAHLGARPGSAGAVQVPSEGNSHLLFLHDNWWSLCACCASSFNPAAGAGSAVRMATTVANSTRMPN